MDIGWSSIPGLGLGLTTQLVETRNDGDRDWGAAVREDGVPLDKVKMSQSPCYSTVMSGTVQSPQHHRGENRRVHQHRGGNKENYQQQGCGGDEARRGGNTIPQCSPLSLVEECRGSTLIGRELHSVATPALLAGSLWHKG